MDFRVGRRKVAPAAKAAVDRLGRLRRG